MALGYLMMLAAPLRAGIKDDVLCLADSLMEGRGHASRGAVEAASYICRRMKQIGYVEVPQKAFLAVGEETFVPTNTLLCVHITTVLDLLAVTFTLVQTVTPQVCLCFCILQKSSGTAERILYS